MPTILAGALKRMPGLPANVVAGVPRVEKDPRGGDVVIVPVRPYAREAWTGAPDVGSVAGRTTGWACAAGGISTSAAPGSFWSTRPGGSIARSTGWTVAMVPWRDARARTRVTSSGRSHS